MTVKHQLLGTIVVILLVATFGISIISITAIENVFTLYSETPNIAYAQIVSKRILHKTILGLIGFIVLIATLTIPLGLYFIKRITAPYLIILEEFSQLASNRFQLSKTHQLTQAEQTLLNDYVITLRHDVEKLRELEKVASFKDGARMLLHELKNPLTPLKLSIDTLMFNDTTPSKTVRRIHLSLQEIEHILESFKTLVSIEFREKKPIPFNTFLSETLLLQQGQTILIKNHCKETSIIFSEPTLLRQILNNLINNGLEHNHDEFHIEIEPCTNHLKINCITPNATIPEDINPFKIKTSTKGTNRGFGLYICKKIADYLDHNLILSSRENPVIFSIEVPYYDSTINS